jgi:bacterioferritin-associated ferredoxin
MVCSCHAISDRDIEKAIAWMRAADPETIITPGKVFRALGRRAECGGCLPLFMDSMAGSPYLEVPGNPPRLTSWSGRRKARQDGVHEG